MAETLSIAEYSLGYVTIQGAAVESPTGFSEYALGVVPLTGASTEALASFTESSSGMAATAGTSAEGLSLSEYAQGYVVLAGTSAEGLSLLEYAQGSLSILGTSAEGAGFRERSAGALLGRSAESILFSETVRGFSPISGTSRGELVFWEHCRGIVAEPAPNVTPTPGADPVDEETTAWCINLTTGGHSRYVGALDGSLTDVVGQVVTAVTQMGVDRAKHVHDLYIHGRLTADLTVTTITDEQTRHSYTIQEDSNSGLHQQRLKLARGVRGTDWQFSVSGAGFSLKSIEVPPVASARTK